MKYVVAAGAALILVVAAVWYFSKAESNQQVQQRQQSQTAEPAPRPTPSSTTATEATPIGVPFVGCEDSGMIEVTPAPKGTEKVVKIDTGAAERLSYYKSASGLGVLAPRGWHCIGRSGSAGRTLFVSPPSVKESDMTWGSIIGPSIVVSGSNGGTSGRFEVAQVVARVFPAHEAFARKVISEGLMPASDFPFGPYPTDKLSVRTEDMVEYETPPHSKGLGTDSVLTPDDNPVEGAAILQNGEGPYLWFLRVRLPADMRDLTSDIIQEVERENSPSPSPGAPVAAPAAALPPQAAQIDEPTPAELDCVCRDMRRSGERCDNPQDAYDFAKHAKHAARMSGLPLCSER